MAPDDEVLFAHVCDEGEACFERAAALASGTEARPGPELSYALANFELHGATLRSLRCWYPEENRVQTALVEWELLNVQLASKGLAV